MPNEPLTGARYPSASAAPNVPQDIENAVRDLADNTIPYFTSTTARDNAYSAWVAAGGAMRSNLFCGVQGTLYRYDTGIPGWHVVPITYETRMMRAQRNVNTAGFPNGSAWTAFANDTNWNEVDPWGMRSTGATVVAPFTGWYVVSGTIWWNNNATGYRSLGLQPVAGLDIGEGSGNVIALDQRNPVSGGVDTVQTGTHQFAMTAGQSVVLVGRQTSGADLTVNAVRISATYLGPNL